MYEKYLEEIKTREKAATPGEWYGTFPDANDNIKILSKDYSLNPVCYVPNRANAEFIIWSHNEFLPDMLAEVERLIKENAELSGKTGKLEQQIATLKKALESVSYGLAKETSITNYDSAVKRLAKGIYNEAVEQEQEQEANA